MKKETILYVDDEEINLLLFQANFEEDYDVIISTSASEGLNILDKNPDINVIVSDIKMPEMNGFEFIRRVKMKYPEKICIILSAFSKYDFTEGTVVEKDIYRYLNKPLRRDIMNQTILEAIEISNS